MQQQFPANLRIMNPVSTLTGARDSLAAINTTQLPDNSIVMVEASNTLYVLRKGSTATEDSPNIIAPAEGGPGRWYRYGAGGSFFSTISVGHTTIAPQTGIDSNSATIPGVASSNDVVSTNLLSSGLAATVVFGILRITGAAAGVYRFTNVGSATVAGATYSARVCVNISP